ncbi:S-DNA-T family DNA segregation ATPase FtsK/SpoIIIE [Haloferula luteola]|uniref:S-DNA-T family DNA segregation ATPase FtsK/SpoIIIE n=1 Tax=Haloferula luteola TaxID=595692 RepID=A0A840UYW1_9BACT|nr:DNA translocase FtsK [Haloferula luteola]MBB5351317.1 S-DNA-T family DNA segregation ATPase FtsK/SpoIIIE [Haloferula luteola]
MSKKDNRKRGEAPEPPKWSNELIGLSLIGLGLVLFLSVLSFTPEDLPVLGMGDSLAPHAEAQSPRGNFLGPLGTVIGLAHVYFAGKAGFLVPVALVWFGVIKLVFDGRLWPRTGTGFVVMILSGSAFLHAGWSQAGELPGAGGVLGRLVADFLMRPIVGKTGTEVIAAVLYLFALILVVGQRPLRFAKGTAQLTMAGIRKVSNGIAERRQRGDQESRLKFEREREKEKRRQERRKPASAPVEDSPTPQAELPLREIPTPQIIDASQRRLDAPKPGDKPFERRKGHASLLTARFEDYDLPGFDLLDVVEEAEESPEANRDELLQVQRTIVDTLRSFGIETTAGDITRGPTITRYEIYPSVGLRVSRISQLEADIARATKAERINILAPIPGKDTVGIELANSVKVAVPLRELLQDPEFRSAKKKIPLALGKDVYGKTVIGDLAAMPHLLVAGATGSGKSVCINSIIASMLFKFGPDELRFIMVDPKVVEMQMYNKLPHLVVPVVTDPKKVVAALKWVVNEMEKRYRVFAKCGVRNFDGFNNRPREEKAPVEPLADAAAEPPWEEEEVDQEEIESIAAALESGELGPEAEDDELEIEEDEIPDRFPYIVVIVDELADLMQTAPAEVEMNIARIAQKARAAGIHLVIATQTPRADVVTGIIKANIPCRVAFQVSSQLDSRVILDSKGAEKLVGKGDMLYLPPGSAKLERAQGAFVSDEEVERLVKHCSGQAEPNFVEDIQRSIESAANDDGEEELSDADEDMIMKCIDVVRQEQKCSTSLLQRRLRLGYTRAARMVDILEQRGIVGPGDGAKAREVYVK